MEIEVDIQRRDELYQEIVKSEKEGSTEKIIELCFRVANLNIPDLEKSVALINAGRIYANLKKVDKSVECYDKAVEIEVKHNRFFALEQKAAVLAELGKYKESLEIYRNLIKRNDLFISDIQRFQNNIDALGKV